MIDTSLQLKSERTDSLYKCSSCYIIICGCIFFVCGLCVYVFVCCVIFCVHARNYFPNPGQSSRILAKMPKPTCVDCETTDSFLWRNVEGGQICNDCYLSNNTPKVRKATTSTVKSENDNKKEDKIDTAIKAEIETTPAKATGKGTRKSTRATRYKPKTPASTASKAPSSRGRGRRSLFKRPPLKAPTATPTVVTSDSVFYKGNYMQVGDIVSMLDMDGGTYYAQLRGFMTDQYCEKSAVVTWLLPTKASPPPEETFDPATYILGPEEEMPRKLEYMDFVMHAPSDYYKASNSPYPLVEQELTGYSGYIWTSLEPKDRR